jgi:hypothetical protein
MRTKETPIEPNETCINPWMGRNVDWNLTPPVASRSNWEEEPEDEEEEQEEDELEEEACQ